MNHEARASEGRAGLVKRLQHLILAIGVLLVTASGPARADEPPVTDLPTLFSLSGKMPGLAARFTEERQIALLAEPLRSEGTLHFARVRFDEETRRRRPTTCQMTREVLERLADDLVASVP